MDANELRKYIREHAGQYAYKEKHEDGTTEYHIYCGYHKTSNCAIVSARIGWTPNCLQEYDAIFVSPFDYDYMFYVSFRELASLANLDYTDK